VLKATSCGVAEPQAGWSFPWSNTMNCAWFAHSMLADFAVDKPKKIMLGKKSSHPESPREKYSRF